MTDEKQRLGIDWKLKLGNIYFWFFIAVFKKTVLTLCSFILILIGNLSFNVALEVFFADFIKKILLNAWPDFNS